MDLDVSNNGNIKKITLHPPFWEQTDEENYTTSSIFEQNDFYVDFEILDHKTDSISYLFKAKNKTKIELGNSFKGGKWVAELKRAYEMNIPDAIIKIDGTRYLSTDLFHMIKVEEGKKVGVIMDHKASIENHQKIKNTYFGCDEVYIECFYRDEDKEFAEKNYHSYASLSGRIMRECKIKNAIPVHFSRKYDEIEIEQLIEQFERARKAPNEA